MNSFKAVIGNALVLATLVILLAGGLLVTQANPGAADASSASVPLAGFPPDPPASNGGSAAAAAAASELADEILPRGPFWMKTPRGSLIDSVY